jgi:hypothetical protein
LSAATVNQRLAALRGIARHHGRPLRIPGVKQTPPPIATLNGREIGRLLAAVDGPHWLDKRNAAIIGVGDHHMNKLKIGRGACNKRLCLSKRLHQSSQGVRKMSGR